MINLFVTGIHSQKLGRPPTGRERRAGKNSKWLIKLATGNRTKSFNTSALTHSFYTSFPSPPPQRYLSQSISFLKLAMGNLFSRSELDENESCVGAYTYNPCWVCGPLNALFCCCLPVWREGGGFGVLFNDGIRFRDPAWDNGSSLRSDFEEALNGEAMREALLEAPKTGDGYGILVPELAPVLNKSFCADINEKLLAPHGFRCEARFWLTYPNSIGRGSRADPDEHFALAIFKTDAGAGSGALELVDQGSAEGRAAK